MRKPFHIICLAVILVAGMHAPVHAQDMPRIPTIDVTGRATITVEPNMAVITFSVETTDEKAVGALNKNAKQMKALLQAMKETAGEQATISTSNFSVYPLYDRKVETNGGPVSYRVTNSLSVETDRIEKTGFLIDTAVNAGANRIGSLSFTRSDLDQFQRQAAAKALENAMEYGEVLAKTAGLAIEKILSIKYAPSSTVFNHQRLAFAEEGAGTPVSPGTIPVESYVDVCFAVNPAK